jgi:hypothetical protein
MARIAPDESAFDLGLLGQRPVALGAAHCAHHGATPDLLLRFGLVGQAGGHGHQSVASDGDALARLQHRDHLARRCFQHHRRLELVVVGVIGQRFGDASVQQ